MSTSRAVTWEGFFNTRDLGGLPTTSGGMTSYGAFFRAADLRFVTETGWAQARESGVRTVIDLRNADEIRPTDTPLTAQAGSAQFAASPEGPAAPTAVGRFEVPLDDIDDIEFWQHVNRERLNGTPLYYPVFLRRKAERCAAVIKKIAHTDPGGVLFHCGGGRDRTGLIALLLLALADVEPQAIAGDYALSAEALKALYAAMGTADQQPVIQAILADRGTTAEEAVMATLDGFDVEQYLLSAGVTSSELHSVRSRLSSLHIH
ncbi:tyrosine-protein phosphatase [Amycolatopsis cihanbeyliensis]|uniref:Protein tyrosine/serine phosphatase n=1 Tax=Amycolatopsis cihanbeyliensis TaxID=1128664 RepID=A0A542DPI7_AMYCI|nr:tyrosine-protein phosphatase [Amycolatopsis cihanbeyliensis]TQJ05021.1 protein tyrosine/serine phosphatase [Amycolatopsis cihanbeyliensis]